MYKLLDDQNVQAAPEPTISETANNKGENMKKVNVATKPGFKMPLWSKRVIGYTLIVTSIVLFVGYFLVYVPAINAYNQAKVVSDNLKVLAAYGKDQNIIGVQGQIPKTKESMDKLKKDAAVLAWTKIIPFAGEYYRDFERGMRAGDAGLDAADKLISVVSPYADLLGLRGKGTYTGSTQDRIARLVDTMDKIIPQIDAVGPQLATVRKEMNSIDPDRYAFKPEIQTALKSAIQQVNDAEALLIESKPFLEVLPQFLGRDKPAKYMVMFQNDKELRASGGFLTAYARLTVDKGRVINSESSDIYKIDEKLPIKVTPPEQILKYLPEPNGKVKTHLQTRDSNYFPDFKESAQTFEWFFSYVKPLDWDGLVAVDTHVVEGIVRVLGSIDVNGVKFSSDIEPRCNCPQVVYELESFAHSSLSGNSERKALIGDLMQAILLEAFKQEDKLPLLAAEAIRLMNEKHVQVYMHDPKLQTTVEHLDWAGRIASADNPTKFKYEEGKWDYWYWNESNYAGQKANLYVKQQSEQQYDVGGDGTITKTITTTVRNDQKNDWWLNGRYRAYFRAFVPEGSILIKGSGAKEEIGAFQQYGKTVFDGFYELSPQQTPVKITLQYKLPFKVKKGEELNMLFQKQPGTTGFKYILNGVGDKQEFDLSKDQKLTVKL
jgi:hypothetical protein